MSVALDETLVARVERMRRPDRLQENVASRNTKAEVAGGSPLTRASSCSASARSSITGPDYVRQPVVERRSRGVAGFIAVWLDFSHLPPARLLRRRKRAIRRCIRRQNFFRRALQTPRIVAAKHFDQHPLGACDQHHHLVQRSLEQIGPVRLTMRP
jgi:hypothetical protein